MIQTSLNAISKILPNGQYFVYCAQIPSATGIGDTEKDAIENMQAAVFVATLNMRNQAVRNENETGEMYKVFSFEMSISTESPMEAMSDSESDVDRKADLVHGLMQNMDNIHSYVDSISKPCEKNFIKAYIKDFKNANFAPIIDRYCAKYQSDKTT